MWGVLTVTMNFGSGKFVVGISGSGLVVVIVSAGWNGVMVGGIAGKVRVEAMPCEHADRIKVQRRSVNFVFTSKDLPRRLPSTPLR